MKSMKVKEEEVDFLKEIINIGSGNAAVALQQLLGTKVIMEIPDVRIIKPSELSSFISSLAKPVLGVKMSIVGDIKGDFYFISPDKDKKALMALADKAAPGYGIRKPESDLSLIEEISNIIAGVFTFAVHDFCGLNIFHTVPEARNDLLASLLDESISARARGNTEFIMIENMFYVDSKIEHKINVSLILILALDSIDLLTGSIKKARERMMEG